ncbi:UNVERIFIED_CONTAM: hypothetical protein Slati_0213100 [Sesamum latifolium]|uniref:Uncharacterized protein n=1 Tax=Sesamum latifolium TaxID=2727402 RepID=A0AAW2YBN5_9LAMI
MYDEVSIIRLNTLTWLDQVNIRPKMDLDQKVFDLSKPSIHNNVVRKLPLSKCGLTSRGTLGIEESCTIVVKDEA